MKYRYKRKTRMTWIVRVLLALLTLHSSLITATAQSVEAHISSLEMLVGEQVDLTVTAHAKDTARVEFPRALLLPTDIEVLQAIEEEAQKESDGMVSRTCHYILTAFVDTLYPLPPIPVRISGKEYTTPQLALDVHTLDIDTTKAGWQDEYFGPKDVMPIAMDWKKDEWYKPLWAAFAAVVLILIGIWVVARLISNKPIIARIRIIKHVPPHQKAMKAINQIKAENMQTAENPKEYYTRLTDTLRQYIYERYGFNAMEMTSSEIIDRLTKTDDPKALNELRQLFLTADLVKFAKYSTLLGENDTNLVNAIDFINQTKQENVPTEEVIKPELTTEQKQSRKLRGVLIAIATAIAIATVALLVYVGWFLYDLLMY